MSIVSKKREELEEIETAKFVTSALRDISATQIKQLKEEFNTNLKFYKEVSELYVSVKKEAFRRINRNPELKLSLLGGEIGKKGVLSVALTSNAHFYGILNKEVMDKFLEHIRENQQENCLVIGKTGAQYIEDKKEIERCDLMAFEGKTPTTKEMREFLEKVEPYGSVYVFYPSFINVFEQRPEITDIAYMPEEKPGEMESKPKYISEPMLPKILNFFNNQVKYILFKRTMLEADLSKTAARVIKMDRAEGKADEILTTEKGALEEQIKQVQNMRLLETFAGHKIWKKKEQQN